MTLKIAQREEYLHSRSKPRGAPHPQAQKKDFFFLTRMMDSAKLKLTVVIFHSACFPMRKSAFDVEVANQ